MIRRSGGDAGFSLVECLVTIALLGISVVAIVGALGTAASTTGLQARQADADAALRSGAELVKSQPYVACPLVAAYDPSTATTSTEVSLELASLEHWNGSAFQESCPALDGGFQRVTLRAASADGTFQRTLELIKRRP